jgi:hypothetical protein
VSETDTRYAGGCTDWSRFDVPALAGFVNEDLSSGWTQVSAWWQAYDLTREHLVVLRQARETIVRVWPPQTNRAAAAYLDQLDALIASMDNMRVAAEANGRALAGILTVLDNARGTVDGLHERWRQQQESLWSEVGAVASAATGNPAGLVDVSIALASSDEKARLNAQAQATMRATDQAVYEYLPQLVIPVGRQNPIEDVKPVGTGTRDGAGSSSGGGSLRPPVIPPAPAPAPAPVAGPVLTGGASPQQGGAPVVGVPGAGQPASGIGGGSGASWLVPGSPWTQTPVGRVLRSGAVIGAPMDLVEPGSSSAAGRIAGDLPEPSRPGASEVGPEGGLLGGGIGAGRPPDRRLRRTLPPDTEWPVRQGVPAVLEPGPEREIRHDPGPGVFGIDR